jgi:hypothetical protein
MTPYRITEIGFEKSEAIFFRTTVEMVSNNEAADWLWVGDRNADVILINADRREIRSKFNSGKFSSNSIRTVLIGCSSSGEKCDLFSRMLKKPISYSMITTLLLELETEFGPVEQVSSSLDTQVAELDRDQVIELGEDQVVEPDQEECSTVSLNRQIFLGSVEQPEKTASSVSHPDKDEQIQSDQDDSVDDDSDYDVYGHLLDYEYDRFQKGDAKAPAIEAQRIPVENVRTVEEHEQSKAPKKLRWYEKFSLMKPAVGRLNENKRFLGIIRKLVLTGNPSEITHFIYPTVRIYPEQQIFAHKSCRGLSPELFSAWAAGFSSRELVKSEVCVPSNDWDAQPLWLLFYLAALYGSGGKLMKNNSLCDRLSLNSGPDFNIVPHDSAYKKIADFMVANESQDIDSIAKGSGVKAGTVINFCNACQEIDLIDRTHFSCSETQKATETVPSQKADISTPDKDEEINKGLVSGSISK